MTKTEMIENFLKKLKTRKNKNIIYIIVAVLILGTFGYRFYSVIHERNFDVFNIVRNNIAMGTPVDVLEMQKTNGVLYEPITIKNNRAYVSGVRVNMFHAGQKVGNCKIVSMSHNIDLDTGMHIIKTSKCANGLQYAEKEKNGFYVPVSAIHGNVVYVMDSGVAHAREIVIEDRDAQNALIKSVLNEGDIVILSNITENEKVKVIK